MSHSTYGSSSPLSGLISVLCQTVLSSHSEFLCFFVATFIFSLTFLVVLSQHWKQNVKTSLIQFAQILGGPLN